MQEQLFSPKDNQDRIFIKLPSHQHLILKDICEKHYKISNQMETL